jgi:outer membrane protein assembly factor BamB
MNDLREDLTRHAAGFVPSHQGYERVLSRVARRRLLRRIATGITAFVIAIVAFAGLWSVTRSSKPAVGPEPTVSAPSPNIEIPPEQLRIGLRTDVDGWIVLPDGFGVWVAGSDLLSVDPETGHVTETTHGMRWDYDYVLLVEYGEGSVWVASGSTLWLIDARSGTTIRRFDLSSLGTIDDLFQSSGPAGTWVTADGPDGNVLVQIDPDTGDVLYQHPVGQGVHQMTEADGYLFVSSRSSAHDLIRVDPVSGDTMFVPNVHPDSMAGIGHKVWVDEGDHVHCIDAALPAADCAEIEIPRATTLAADGQDLWVLSGTGSTSSAIYLPDPNQPATVTLVDGLTGQVVGGPLSLPDVTPATISASDGHAWVGFHDTGRLLRIDATKPP